MCDDDDHQTCTESEGERLAESRPRCTCYPGQPEFHDCHPDVDCRVHGLCAYYGHPVEDSQGCRCGAIWTGEPPF